MKHKHEQHTFPLGTEVVAGVNLGGYQIGDEDGSFYTMPNELPPFRLTLFADNHATHSVPDTFTWSAYDPNSTKADSFSFDD